MSGTWYDSAGNPRDPNEATEDDDYFVGTEAANNEDGLGGNDTMFGIGGSNILNGGDGNDALIGGGQGDQLNGGPGDDTLFGEEGNDFLNGGDGNDFLVGQADWDQVIGGAGSDTIYVVPGAGNGELVGDSEDWIYIDAPSFTTNAAGPDDTSYTVFPENGDSFNVTGIPNSNVILAPPGSLPVEPAMPCFAEGTRIATARGEIPVEALRAGDLVVSPGDSGARLQPVIWVGHSRTAVARHVRPDGVAPIRIGAGALGEGVPFRDLRVSPDHALFLDGHLVPAKYLVNGTSIVQETWRRSVTYWHVELPAHGLLVSDGAVTESYFDDGNRQRFDNLDVTVLFGDFAAGARYDVEACRPVLRDGPLLDALRARIALRAEALGMCRGGLAAA